MRVGHRIIDINGQSVVAVPHEKIVSMLATAVGEVHDSFYYFLLWQVVRSSNLQPIGHRSLGCSASRNDPNQVNNNNNT